MRLIVALAIVACVTTLAWAVLAPTALARALRRARLARGVVRDGVRERLGEIPLLRAWRPVDAETLRLAELTGVTTTDLALAKIGAAATVGIVVLVVGAPAFALGPLSFGAFVAPSEWVRRRATGRAATRRAALLPFVERLMALASAGLTLEQALLRLADTESPLRPLLREVRTRVELGMSALDALAELAGREHVAELRDLAHDLARARHGGRAVLPVLAERREVLRLARRAERLDAASRVDGALSVVLVLAYLPALLLLVVVPLFLGLLKALGT